MGRPSDVRVTSMRIENDRWAVCGKRRDGLLSFDHTGTSDAAVAVAISFFKRGVGAAYGEPRDCGITPEFFEWHIRTILPELLTTTRR